MRFQKAFTLVELMIVVAIIGIVAFVAVPSYQQHMESTRRATAQGDLLELAQFMERQYTNGYDFREDNGDAPDLPFNTSPRQGGDPVYNYAFEGAVGRSTFQIRATPVGSQVGDNCGWLQIDQAGVQTSESGNARCWQ